MTPEEFIDKLFPEFSPKKPLRCPWCKSEIHGITGMMTDSKPSAGQPLICDQCSKISLFLGSAELRRPTHEEVTALLDNPEFVMLYTFAQLAIASKNSE